MSASTGTPASQGRTFASLMNEQYRITKRLGGGSFGDIYLGVGQNGEQVAVKFEKHCTRCPQLRHEYKVYRELQNCTGFGRVYYYGTYNSYNAMVMDLLGPSLEDLFTKCGRRFSLRTVLQVADQLLDRMETMHSRHLIHRDVKPANFVLGPGRGCQTIFCIDFGLSTRYRHPRTLQHIPYRDGRSLTGTPRYASINNHLGLEQSRRDDLESIGFVLVYFLKGSLPWQGLKARNAKRKYKIIMERKQAISIQQLCQGLPQQFAEYLAYCRSLKFEAKPNVPYLQGLLRELYKVQGHSPSGTPEWDWSKFEGGSGRGGVESISGEAIATSDNPGETQVPGVWQAVPAEVKATTKANLTPVVRSKNGESHVGNPGVGHEHERPGAQPPAKRSTTEDDKKHNSDNTSDRCQLEPQNGENDNQATEFTGNSRGRCAGGRNATRRSRGHSPVHGTAGWSMWNLRPKTSGTFWGRGVQETTPSEAGKRVPGGGQAQVAATLGVAQVAHGSSRRPLAGETPRIEGACKGHGIHWGTNSVPPDVATKNARPHTAHGLRESDITRGRGDAAPVVAGARGMMRYRNERIGSGGRSLTGCACGGGDPSLSGRNGANHAWSGGDGGNRRRDTIHRTTSIESTAVRATESTYLLGRSSYAVGRRHDIALRNAEDKKKHFVTARIAEGRQRPSSARLRGLAASPTFNVHPSRKPELPMATAGE
ncbi:unnamed protein product [Ectocarpus sp. 12 AP-2014]